MLTWSSITSCWRCRANSRPTRRWRPKAARWWRRWSTRRGRSTGRGRVPPRRQCKQGVSSRSQSRPAARLLNRPSGNSSKFRGPFCHPLWAVFFVGWALEPTRYACTPPRGLKSPPYKTPGFSTHASAPPGRQSRPTLQLLKTARRAPGSATGPAAGRPASRGRCARASSPAPSARPSRTSGGSGAFCLRAG